MDNAGNVAFRALWANSERVLRDVLDALVSGAPTPIGDSQAKLGPMLQGMGVMYDVLGFAD